MRGERPQVEAQFPCAGTSPAIVRLRSAVATAAFALALLAGLACAQANPPSVNVWYGLNQTFGQPGLAQRWVNVLGSASDPDGIKSLSYTLNGGSSKPLSVGPDTRRLLSPGDFNVEIARTDLLPGLNQVTIKATDNALETTFETVTIDYSAHTVWPENFSIDWSTVNDIQDVTQVVDGMWAFNSTGVRPVVMGYDRTIAVGDASWDDYEVVATITLHGLDTGVCNLTSTACNTNGCPWPSVAPAAAMLLRWPGHTAWDGAQPTWGWEPAGAGMWWNPACGGPLELTGDDGLNESDPGASIEFGVPCFWKMRVQSMPGQGTFYAGKVWVVGQPEPPDWMLSGLEDQTDVPGGSMLIVAHHVDLTVGDVQITRLPDPNPPVIENVSVVTTTTTAAIDWSTNERASGSFRYGLTPGYELGTIDDPAETLSHTVELSGLTTGQLYRYEITAIDLDANVTTTGDSVFVPSNDNDPPIISGVTVTPGAGSAAISWTTDEPATSTVDYGTTQTYDHTLTDMSLATQHTVSLAQLDPGTLYHFRVRSQDASANESASQDMIFSTAGLLASYFEDFDSYDCDADPTGWFDTGPNNSLSQDDARFKVFCLDGEKAFGTTSLASNIHSHYTGAGSAAWAGYTYSGRMRITQSGGGIGVTFLSDYPDSDAYYRLRRGNFTGGAAFQIDPHGTSVTGGTISTGVVPSPNEWYRFVVDVRTTPIRTEIRAKVWAEVSPGPSRWQVDCYDSSPTRRTIGRIGVWSMGSGAKYWDDLAVSTPDCNANGVSDALEIAGGTSDDCNTNGVPDDCDADCNTNGVPDDCEVLTDCNTNGVPDECESFADCNTNGVPDECDLPAHDANNNGVPDECDIAGDCDGNGQLQSADYADFASCMAGPGAPLPQFATSGCLCRETFDFNSDVQIDLADFAVLQAQSWP